MPIGVDPRSVSNEKYDPMIFIKRKADDFIIYAIIEFSLMI
jgi:hypothetical protein